MVTEKICLGGTVDGSILDVGKINLSFSISGVFFQSGILRDQSLCHDTLHIKGEYILSLTCTRFGRVLGNAGSNGFLLGFRGHNKLIVRSESGNIVYCGSCTAMRLVRGCCNIGGKATLVK